MNRFFPGVIDYDGRMSANYSCGRTLSTEAASIWAQSVATFVPTTQRPRILDLGSGTGRFSKLFGEAFEAAHIVGDRAISAHARRCPKCRSVVHEHRRVQQITCDSLQEFAGRTKLRADTALTLISDGEFLEGQSAIEKAASVARVPEPVVETIEILVFTRDDHRDERATSNVGG